MRFGLTKRPALRTALRMFNAKGVSLMGAGAKVVRGRKPMNSYKVTAVVTLEVYLRATDANEARAKVQQSLDDGIDLRADVVTEIVAQAIWPVEEDAGTKLATATKPKWDPSDEVLLADGRLVRIMEVYDTHYMVKLRRAGKFSHQHFRMSRVEIDDHGKLRERT